MRIQSSTSYINYAQRTQPLRAAGSCPHGNPSGTCPLCTGMGGGGGSSSVIKPKPTPKELGLLTWADLMPVWYAMQAQKNRKEYEAALDKASIVKNIVEKSQIYLAINKFINSEIKPVLKFLDSKILTPLTKAITLYAKITAQVANMLYTELKNQVAGQLIKLSAVLNEKLQQVLEKLKQSAEIFRGMIENFISGMKEKEKALKEYFFALSNKFKKRIYKIIKSIDASLKKESAENIFSTEYEEFNNAQ